MRIEELKNEEEEEDVESIYTKYLERAIWRRRQWAHNHLIYYFNLIIVEWGFYKWWGPGRFGRGNGIGPRFRIY